MYKMYITFIDAAKKIKIIKILNSENFFVSLKLLLICSKNNPNIKNIKICGVLSVPCSAIL